MDREEIKSHLLQKFPRKYGNPKKMEKIMQKLELLDFEFNVALEHFFRDGTIDGISVSDYSLRRIMIDCNVDAVEGIVILDWLKKDYFNAVAALGEAEMYIYE